MFASQPTRSNVDTQFISGKNAVYFLGAPDFMYTYRSGYALLYMWKGNAEVTLGTEHFLVPEGNYLLINNGSRVRGIQGEGAELFLVSFTPRLILGAFQDLQAKKKELLADPFGSDRKIPGFLEQVYPLSGSRLKKKLGQLRHPELSRPVKWRQITVGNAWFRQIAGLILLEQQEPLRQIRQIKSKKYTTRKDLYRKVHCGREYIRANWGRHIGSGRKRTSCFYVSLSFSPYIL